MILLLLILNLAFAEELVPKEGAASLVRAIDGGGVYYPLESGGVLEFTVVGPIELDIEARQRLPASSVEFGLVTVSAQGDGMHILTIKVEGPADPTGTVMDGVGGIPTVMDQAQITVPAGEHVFTLVYDEGAHPVLIRVTVEGEMSPPAPDPVTAEPPTVEAEVLDEDELDLTDFDLEEDTFDDDTFDDLDENEALLDEVPSDDATPVDPVTVEPAPVEDLPEDSDSVRVPPKRQEHASLAAVRLGVGDTRAGSKASLYLGVEFLKPLMPGWGLSVRLGHYNIALDTPITVQPAIGHYAGVTQKVSWTTRVRQLDTSLRRELGLGPTGLNLYGQAGAALYYSTRLYGSQSLGFGNDNNLAYNGPQATVPEPVRGASVGLSGALGLEIPVGRGALAPEIAVHTGRRSFGNTAPSGGEAREPLSSAHLNVAYVVGF